MRGKVVITGSDEAKLFRYLLGHDALFDFLGGVAAGRSAVERGPRET